MAMTSSNVVEGSSGGLGRMWGWIYPTRIRYEHPFHKFYIRATKLPTPKYPRPAKRYEKTSGSLANGPYQDILRINIGENILPLLWSLWKPGKRLLRVESTTSSSNEFTYASGYAQIRSFAKCLRKFFIDGTLCALRSVLKFGGYIFTTQKAFLYVTIQERIQIWIKILLDKHFMILFKLYVKLS